MKEAKRLYYHRTFLLYQNNVRKTWAVIQETLQRKKKHEMPHEFVSASGRHIGNIEFEKKKNINKNF